MKKILYIFTFLVAMVTQGQTALWNYGNIEVHDQGQLGFHTNFINNEPFTTTTGLIGFYGTNTITVAGASVPILYDIEIANDAGVLLSLRIDNTNNTNFITGDFRTIKTQSTSYLNFLNNASYVGSSNFSKVDGYVAITNQQNFIFPVGDDEELRPLILNSSDVNALAKCAYFRENPDNPISLNAIFNTNAKPPVIRAVSTLEFWRLECSEISSISLSWSERSQMESIAIDLIDIIPVGWHKTTRQWMDLGVSEIEGDLLQGYVKSENFNPNDYEIITLAAKENREVLSNQVLTLDNFLITPNGDGNNDTLVIPELEQSPNNTIQIFDRYGLKVFEATNYTNNFNGFSNQNNILFGKEEGLPIGVYFYIVSMEDIEMNFQGFLYLAR